MSFILKALKKVEEEKAARKGGVADLHRALMADSGTEKFSSSKVVPAAVMIMALIAAITLTWEFMKPGKMPTGEGIAKTVSTGEAGRAEQAQPVNSPAPVTAPEPMPAPVTAAPAPVMPRTNGTEAPHTAAGPRKTGHIAAMQQPVTRSHRELTGTAPADLKVNGIAYQEDPAESMAVVNGLLVKRGMTVGGMRVDKIFRDRVRFSGNSGPFDLQLSK